MSRRNTNNVSLFPFLAVLVCAMGALILLLLVTTRRIRSDQLQELLAEEAPTDQAEPAIIEPPPVAPSLPEIKVPTREPSVFPSHPAMIVDHVPPNVSEPDRDDQMEQRDLVALRGYGALLQDKIAKSNELKQQLQARFASLRTEKNQLEDVAKKLDKQVSDTRLARENVEETQRRLDAQLAALRRAIQKQESEPVNAVSKYRIVPFDGLSGTIRRPIMIECDGNKFRFIPEDVQLSQAEIESFVGGYNPLLSGAAALTAYWAKKDRESGEPVGDPYVLLVVRPGGSMGFYTAKRMLRSLDLPIGYELVPDGRELDLPAADPIATRLCRDAVETTLRNKDKIRSLQPLTKSLIAQVERDRARGFGRPPGSPADQNAPVLDDERARRFRRMVTQAPDRYSNGLPSRSAFPPRNTDRSQLPSSRRKLGQFAPGQNPGSQVPPDPVDPNHPATANTDQPGRLPFFDAAARAGRGQAQPVPGVVAMPGPITPEDNGQSSVARELTELPELPKYEPQDRRGTGAASRGQLPNAKPRVTSPPIPPGDVGNVARSDVFGPGTPPTNPVGQRAGVGLPPGVRSSEATAAGKGQPSVVTDSSTKPGQPGVQPNGAQPPANPKQPNVRYRRAVQLVVSPNAVAVGGNARVAIDDKQVSGPWLGTVLTQIEAAVRAWGQPPQGMQWAPEVRFRIGSGAGPTHAKLRDALRRLGIRTTDEPVQPAKPAAGTKPVIQQQSGTRWRRSRNKIQRVGGSQ